jgi:hypothetical protein
LERAVKREGSYYFSFFFSKIRLENQNIILYTKLFVKQSLGLFKNLGLKSFKIYASLRQLQFDVFRELNMLTGRKIDKKISQFFTNFPPLLSERPEISLRPLN